MNFYSTNKRSPAVSFKEAVIRGQAPDGGLFFPENIPTLSADFYKRLPGMSLAEIADEVLLPFVAGAINTAQLQDITKEVFNFDIPLVSIEPGISSLELFHGPTCAFKDVGARFMSRVLQLLVTAGKKNTVLVATSGDTGSAVANAFLGASNIDVVILYPAGKVSAIQEKQFASLGKNTRAIAINGTFDNCQALVKKAFSDSELNKEISLSSANSINIARWLPQAVYYFYAVGQLMKQGIKEKIVVAVPSGNFGNLAAGLLAKKMGLPVDHFIAATNSNRVVPDYLSSGAFNPKPSVATMANAMDVGNPSNFVRMLEMYDHDHVAMTKDIQGCYFDDEAVKQAIIDVYKTHGYILDPHGAIGWLALKKMKATGETAIFLETAAPAKFREAVEPLIGKQLELPESLQQFVDREVRSIKMENNYEELRLFLEEKD